MTASGPKQTLLRPSHSRIICLSQFSAVVLTPYNAQGCFMLLNINKGSPGLRIYRSTWLIVAAVFFSWCAMAGKPTPEAQLATIAATPIALVYIVFQTQKIVFQWREHGVSSLLANLFIVIFVLGSGPHRSHIQGDDFRP
jgi:quinol-cytochrome oxidoreductase complex cytochrome b subunit